MHNLRFYRNNNIGNKFKISTLLLTVLIIYVIKYIEQGELIEHKEQLPLDKNNMNGGMTYVITKYFWRKLC